MIAIVTLVASFARLATAQQPGVIEPLAEACGAKTADIVCINHYAAVIPAHFGRNALAWEQFEEDSIRTMTINDSSFASLVPSADFIIFDQQRALEILGDSPTYDFIFNVSDYYHEAPVYVPTQNKIYKSQLKPSGFLPLYAIDLNKDPVTLETLELNPPLYAPNDAQYVNGSIYWAVAGSNNSIGNPPREQHSGIYKTDPATGDTICLLNNYFGYYFNGPNDLAVHKNGDIWFTDTSKYPPALNISSCLLVPAKPNFSTQTTHGGPTSAKPRPKRMPPVRPLIPQSPPAKKSPSNPPLRQSTASGPPPAPSTSSPNPSKWPTASNSPRTKKPST